MRLQDSDGGDQRFRLLVDSIHDYSVYMVDPTGHVATWNAGAERNKGYTADEIIGRHFSCFFLPEDAANDLPGRILATAAGGRYENEEWRVRKDGSRFWASVVVRPMYAETGGLSGFAKITRDLTERKQYEDSLRRSERRFRTIMENSPVAMALVGLDGRWLEVNGALCDFLGYTPDELGRLDFQALTFAEDLAADLERVGAVLAGEFSDYRLEKRYLRKGGAVIWGLLSVSVFRDADGGPLYFISQIENIDRLKKAEEAIHAERDHLHLMLSSIADGVISIDGAHRVEMMNPAAETMTGWPLEQAKGRPLDDVFRLINRVDGRSLENPAPEWLAEPRIARPSEPGVLVSRQGELRDIQNTVTPIRTRRGQVAGAVLVFQDMTRVHDIERQLTFHAEQDVLTGLFNRRTLESKLDDRLRIVREIGGGHVLSFLDLDRFKIVNDTAGHLAGDMLLREVAQTLRQHLLPSDFVARLGGDEFAMILHDRSLAEAEEILETILEAVARIRFAWEGRTYGITASIGAAVIDASSPSASHAMRQADVACYAAKHAGRNRVCLYQAGQTEVGERHRELLLAADLREALVDDRFVLFAQEVVPTQRATVPGRRFELLLRMLGSDGAPISPRSFIPIAERYDLMAEIDRWVIQHALVTYGPRLGAVAGMSININISANSLNDPKFLPFFLSVLGRSPLDPRSVTIEITETALIGNLRQASSIVERLRTAGCRIALDDFGIGLSSFGYLRSFAVDVIKIEGSFVRNMVDNRIDLAIVKSIASIARELKAETVAEFVETADVLEAVRGLNIDYAQGYVFGAPQPLESVLAAIEAGR